jgi:hypothetical protein
VLQTILCALFNRARGTQFFNHIASTSLSRIFSTLLMALSTCTNWQTLLFIWAGMLVWSIPAWDAYWGACAGNELDRYKSAVSFIDYILKKLNLKNVRIYGIIGMGLRQGLFAIPVLMCLGHFYLIPIPFLFGIPYWAFSYINKNTPGSFVEYSELLIGAIWGLIL